MSFSAVHNLSASGRSSRVQRQPLQRRVRASVVCLAGAPQAASYRYARMAWATRGTPAVVSAKSSWSRQGGLRSGACSLSAARDGLGG
jgi:hypothetical protein